MESHNYIHIQSPSDSSVGVCGSRSVGGFVRSKPGSSCPYCQRGEPWRGLVLKQEQPPEAAEVAVKFGSILVPAAYTRPDGSWETRWAVVDSIPEDKVYGVAKGPPNAAETVVMITDLAPDFPPDLTSKVSVQNLKAAPDLWCDY